MAKEAVIPFKGPAEQEEQPQQTRPTTTSRRSSLAGFSISSLMSNTTTRNSEQEEEEHASVKEAILYDPQSESKLKAHRNEVITAILEERPRFVVAFEKMEINGHTIQLEVPSQTLYEEIMRSKTEILLTAVRTANISGALELSIKVNEQVHIARPIKLEDRIKHMTEKNPQLMELKKILDMEYE